MFCKALTLSARILLSCMIALLLLSGSITTPEAQAQSHRDTLRYFSLASPYHTIYTHLRYLQKDIWNPSVAARTLAVDDPFSAEAQELAIHLKEVLDGNLLYVDLDALPTDPHYVDTLTDLQQYVPFPDWPNIYVERIDGRWLYSRTTVKATPILWNKLYVWGVDKFIQTFDSFTSDTILGLRLGQWVVLLLLLAFTILLHKILTWISSNVILRILEKYWQGTIAGQIIRDAARPVSILVLNLVVIAILPELRLPVLLTKYVSMALQIVASVFAIVIFYRLVDLVSAMFERLAERTESTLDDHLVPLVRKVLKVIVLLGGIAFILQNYWGVDITALLAGISIGGLAFALAAQDTVKNLFGSVMIFIDKPFQVGDWVVFKGGEGTVEEVGVRSTRVRTFYNSIIYVPNATLADSTLDNMGVRQYRRYSTRISVTYDTPPELIDGFVKGLREIINFHPRTRKDYYQIFLNDMSASSLEILFYVFFEVPDWTEELRARHEVLLAILKLADKLGVRFAFPTETIHVESFPEKRSLTPESDLDQDVNAKIASVVQQWKKEESDR